MSDTRPLYEPGSLVCMTHGSPCCGHHPACVPAVRGIDPDGTTSLWLLGTSSPDEAPSWHYTPRHEDLGHLPTDVQRRVDHGPTCDTWTRTNTRCRRPVDQHGHTCWQHTPHHQPSTTTTSDRSTRA